MIDEMQALEHNGSWDLVLFVQEKNLLVVNRSMLLKLDLKDRFIVSNLVWWPKVIHRFMALIMVILLSVIGHYISWILKMHFNIEN